MKYCPYQATLYALQDLDFSSYLQKWDAECGRAVAGASEFMEEWNLACFCVTDQDTGGNEVIAGAVSGKPCRLVRLLLSPRSMRGSMDRIDRGSDQSGEIRCPNMFHKSFA